MPTVREKYLNSKMLRDIAQARLHECLVQDPQCELKITQQLRALVADGDAEIAELRKQMEEEEPGISNSDRDNR